MPRPFQRFGQTVVSINLGFVLFLYASQTNNNYQPQEQHIQLNRIILQRDERELTAEPIPQTEEEKQADSVILSGINDAVRFNTVLHFGIDYPGQANDGFTYYIPWYEIPKPLALIFLLSI